MILKIENLSKKFKDKVVYDDVSISFKEGGIYGLIGRNGAGKSTLFKLIAKEIKKDAGSIYLDDKPITNHDVTIIYDNPILPNFMSGYEYLSFINDLHGDKEKSFTKYFNEFDFKLDDLNDLIKNYSLGMKAKLQIIAALIIKPKVILLDEPLTSLDMIVGIKIRNILIGLANEHIIILSTHVMDIAQNLCSEIALINNNKIKHVQYDKENFEKEIIEALKDE